MFDLKFVPLALDAQRAANLIPRQYLADFYKAGLNELQAALNVSVLGKNRGTWAANKWFGSEMFLASILDEIRARDNTLPPLSAEYKSALEQVKNNTALPSWLTNARSKELQLYGVLVWECMKRFESRYLRQRVSLFGRSNPFVAQDVGFWDWVNYYYMRCEYVGDFLSEQTIRELNGVLYEQSISAFYRRSALIRVLPRFKFDDRKSRMYRTPKTMTDRRFTPALRERLSKVGIGPLGT